MITFSVPNHGGPDEIIFKLSMTTDASTAVPCPLHYTCAFCDDSTCSPEKESMEENAYDDFPIKTRLFRSILIFSVIIVLTYSCPDMFPQLHIFSFRYGTEIEYSCPLGQDLFINDIPQPTFKTTCQWGETWSPSPPSPWPCERKYQNFF